MVKEEENMSATYMGANLIKHGDGLSVMGSNPRVTGNGCFVTGSNATVKGNRNNVNGSNARVKGNDCTVTGSNANVKGARNKVVGSNARVDGDECEVDGSHAVVTGFGCTVTGTNSKLNGELVSSNVGVGSSMHIGVGGMMTITTNGVTQTISNSGSGVGGFSIGIQNIDRSEEKKRKRKRDTWVDELNIKHDSAPDEDKDVPDTELCCICVTNYKKVAIVLCGHTSLCITCAKKLGGEDGVCKCPICNGVVEKIVETF